MGTARRIVTVLHAVKLADGRLVFEPWSCETFEAGLDAMVEAADRARQVARARHSDATRVDHLCTRLMTPDQYAGLRRDPALDPAWILRAPTPRAHEVPVDTAPTG